MRQRSARAGEVLGGENGASRLPLRRKIFSRDGDNEMRETGPEKLDNKSCFINSAFGTNKGFAEVT